MVPPPHWKMALTILMAVYPATLVIPWLLNPMIRQLPELLGHLIVSGCVVATLTWLAMPLLNRMLRPWLHPENARVSIQASHKPEP